MELPRIMNKLVVVNERREDRRLSNAEQLVSCYLKSDLLKVKAGGGECTVIDVSATGFGVETLDKLPVGEDVHLDIRFRGKLLENADAFVAYCHFVEDHYRLGLVFNFRKPEMLSPHTYNFLSRMIDSVTAGKSNPAHH